VLCQLSLLVVGSGLRVHGIRFQAYTVGVLKTETMAYGACGHLGGVDRTVTTRFVHKRRGPVCELRPPTLTTQR
jgi:hypothetical protein